MELNYAVFLKRVFTKVDPDPIIRWHHIPKLDDSVKAYGFISSSMARHIYGGTTQPQFSNSETSKGFTPNASLQVCDSSFQNYSNTSIPLHSNEQPIMRNTGELPDFRCCDAVNSTNCTISDCQHIASNGSQAIASKQVCARVDLKGKSGVNLEDNKLLSSSRNILAINAKAGGLITQKGIIFKSHLPDTQQQTSGVTNSNYSNHLANFRITPKVSPEVPEFPRTQCKRSIHDMFSVNHDTPNFDPDVDMLDVDKKLSISI